MSKIMIKLKENYLKEHLITASGQIIGKKEFVEVNDTDGFVKTYILNDNVYIEDIINKENKNVDLDDSKKIKSKNKDKN